MSYQALYRVWRPQTFDELIGQTVVTETLKNAIKHHQTSHAYLFTGPRGTGKTSAAKIFAKAINCPNQVDGNPCNHCDTCRMITQGQIADVVEIDAASNNGVEEIRNLRDNVRYAASEVPYKVYIIDEVHMLTTGAFNALLKTLEEPPENVVFILATTEPHKIPATIISRTQRFDFQRITQHHLVERMMEILDHDGVTYQKEALQVIARAANGGMRDSLSLLDQALSYQQETVSLASALEVSGSLSQLAFVDYLQAIYQHQGEAAVEVLQAQLQKGKQANRFVEELILFSRDILLTFYSKVNQTLLSPEELAPLQKTIPADFYYLLIDRLNDVQNKMRFSSQTDLYVEVMTIQLAQGLEASLQAEKFTTSSAPEPSTTGAAPIMAMAKLEAQISDLQAQIQRLQDQVQSGESITVAPIGLDSPGQTGDVPPGDNSSNHSQSSATSVAEDSPERKPRSRPSWAHQGYRQDKAQVYYVLNQATKQDFARLQDHWEEILGELVPQDRALFVDAQLYAASPGIVVIGFTDVMFAGNFQHNVDLQKKFYRTSLLILGKAYLVVPILNQEWQGVRQNYLTLRKAAMKQPIEIHAETTAYFRQLEAQMVRTLNLSPIQTEDEADISRVATTPPETSEGGEADLQKLPSASPQAAEVSIDSATSPSLNPVDAPSEAEEASTLTVTRLDSHLSPWVNDPDEDAFDNDADAAEESGGFSQDLPLVSEAVKLFGPDLVHVYYDR